MQAEIEVPNKPKTFFQLHVKPALRRLIWPRRKSFWNVSLEDELEDSNGGPAGQVISRIAGTITGTVILLLGQALLILAPASFLVQVVFVVPGGLPGVIGHQLAEVCVGGGSCDINLLLASYAFALIMIVNILGLLSYSLLSTFGYFDRDDPNDGLLALGVIDERVKLLHDELIAAKVLPAPVVEADDDH